MKRSLLARARIISGLLLAALTLLAGCSMVRLGYTQAPELAYWWLDGYVDFDEQQGPRVRDAIADWFKWHRATQLPDYAEQLARAQREVLEPTTPERACRWFGTLREKANAAYERALPPLAQHVLSMTPAQLRHLERRYAKGNEETRADYLQPDPRERARAAVQRTLDRVEMLYGRLDDSQREALAQGLAASPFDPERWLAERIARQQETLSTLRRLKAERASPEAAQAALRVLAEHTERSPREAYRSYQRKLTDYNCALAAQIHNQTTAAQRQAAAAKLKGWEQDVRSLAGQGGGV